ncbi:hypothetical protein BJ741DRAFT_634444 [Chytriomyces cf. hyalinus JEL632]|nr:hypothetical protein BJ741DRAFT_634444 [Chytriomyces cf. hyalinus JEL632]
MPEDALATRYRHGIPMVPINAIILTAIISFCGLRIPFLRSLPVMLLFISFVRSIITHFTIIAIIAFFTARLIFPIVTIGFIIAATVSFVATSFIGSFIGSVSTIPFLYCALPDGIRMANSASNGRCRTIADRDIADHSWNRDSFKGSCGSEQNGEDEVETHALCC